MKQFTSHELARRLLEQPDLPVEVPARDCGTCEAVLIEVDHDRRVIYLLDADWVGDAVTSDGVRHAL